MDEDGPGEIQIVPGAHAIRTDLPFGRILADLNAGRQHISNQPEMFGRSWGGMLLGGPAPLEQLI